MRAICCLGIAPFARMAGSYRWHRRKKNWALPIAPIAAFK